jgi:hypothetical protein
VAKKNKSFIVSVGVEDKYKNLPIDVVVSMVMAEAEAAGKKAGEEYRRKHGVGGAKESGQSEGKKTKELDINLNFSDMVVDIKKLSNKTSSMRLTSPTGTAGIRG